MDQAKTLWNLRHHHCRTAVSSGAQPYYQSNLPAPQAMMGSDTAAVPAATTTWAAATDPASGHVYYFNTITGETRWELPSPEEGSDVKAVAAGGEEDAAVNGSVEGKATAVAPSTSEQVNEGEQAASVDDARGDDERQASEEGKGETAKQEEEAALNQEEQEADAEPSSKRQRSDDEPSTSSPSSPPPDAAAEEHAKEPAAGTAVGGGAPAGQWATVTDPRTGAPYYFHTATGETRWTPPEDGSVIIAAIPPAAPSYAPQQPYHPPGAYPRFPPHRQHPLASTYVPPPRLPPEVERLHQALARVDGALGAGGADGEEKGGAEGEGAGAGACPWVELYDSSWNKPYYYNTATFETRWDMPPDFVPAQAGEGGDDEDDALLVPPDGLAGYRVSGTLNKMTGRLQASYGGDSRDYDRDLAQMSHFFDPSTLSQTGEGAKKRQGVDPNVDWKKVREEQKLKKQKQKMEWLLKD